MGRQSGNAGFSSTGGETSDTTFDMNSNTDQGVALQVMPGDENWWPADTSCLSEGFAKKDPHDGWYYRGDERVPGVNVVVGDHYGAKPPHWVLKPYAEIGSLFDAAFCGWLTGREVKIIPGIVRPRKRGEPVNVSAAAECALANAKQWWLSTAGRYRVLDTQVTVFAKSMGFAGTMDLVLQDTQTGGIVVVDLKSTAALSDSQASCIAGYALALSTWGVSPAALVLARFDRDLPGVVDWRPLTQAQISTAVAHFGALHMMFEQPVGVAA